MTTNNKNNDKLSPGYTPSEGFSDVLELVKTAILAVVLALTIRTFAYEPFNIPSGSMIPTLLVGDYLFVSKFSYGFSKYSFPFDFVDFEGRIMGDTPERGDVAVFRQPKQPTIDYIKRIVGLPGDTVQVSEGILYINDTPVTRERIGIEHVDDAFGRLANYIQYEETLIKEDGTTKKHMLIERSDEERYDNTGVFIVPEAHYFAMGDNRDSSQDSRVTSAVGVVPYENLVGRAEFVFFSNDGSAGLHQFWKWPSAIRWDRLFMGIQ